MLVVAGSVSVLLFGRADARVDADVPVHLKIERQMYWPEVLRVNGEALLALQSVSEHRRQEGSLTTGEKDLRNFLVTVVGKDPLLLPGEVGECYLIGVKPRYAPGEKENLHGASAFGRSFAYVVRRKDARVIRWGLLQDMIRQLGGLKPP
jgi:hypothetical protein